MCLFMKRYNKLVGASEYIQAWIFWPATVSAQGLFMTELIWTPGSPSQLLGDSFTSTRSTSDNLEDGVSADS